MGIDIAIVLILLLAFFRGYREGFIMSVFLVASYLAGFIATMYFSFIVSDYLSTNFNIPGRWLPLISFALTFALVVFLVRWVGKLIERGSRKLLPTVFNRISGAVLWVVVAFLLVSQLYFVMQRSGIFKDQLIADSQAVPYIEEANVLLEERVGEVVPFLRGTYEKADAYFRELADQVGEEQGE